MFLVVADHGVHAAHGIRALDDLTIYGDVLDAANRATREGSVVTSVLRVRIMNLSVTSDVVGVVLDNGVAWLSIRTNKRALPFYDAANRHKLTREL